MSKFISSLVINSCVVSHCAECGCESNGSEFCELCLPYMNVTSNKGDSMQDRNGVRFLSDLMQEIKDGSNEDTTAVYRMQDAYAKWIKENESLLVECKPENDEAVGWSQEWEEGVIAFYDELMLFREEMGEDVSAYWTRRAKHGAPVSMDKSDELEVSPISGVEDAVEKYGDLEVCSRLFQEGITCGTSFQDSFRNMYFEMGVNANQVHDSVLEVIGTEQEISDLRNHERRLTWSLVESLKQRAEQTKITLEFAEENAKRIVNIVKLRIKLLVMETSNVVEATNTILYPHSNKVMDLLMEVSREMSEGKHNMPYSFYGWKEMSFDKGMTYDKAIEVFAKAKTKNGQLLVDLGVYAQDVIAKQYADLFAKSRSVFLSVTNEISYLLETSSYLETVATLKRSNAKTVELIKIAVKHAQSKLTKEHMDKETWSVLVDAGFIKAKRVSIDTDANVLIEMANKGNFDGLNAEMAKRVIKAARNNKKSGGITLNREAYMTVYNLAA